MEKYLNDIAIEQGFKCYNEYFDWVARKGEKPEVVAQLIESIYKKAIKLALTGLIIKNYAGDLTIEVLDKELNNLI